MTVDTTTDIKKLLRFEQLSEMLGGMARSTLGDLIRNDDFPRPKYIGRRAYWDKDSVNEWLDEHLVDDFNYFTPA